MKKSQLFNMIAALTRRVEELEKRPIGIPYDLFRPPLKQQAPVDCGCPVNYSCNNSACPRAMIITCQTTSANQVTKEESKNPDGL